MNELQILAAKTALNSMMNKGWLDICTIDSIISMTKAVPPKEEYEILRLLHCIHFIDMEPELLRGLPLLIQRVLTGGPLELKIEFNRDVKTKLLQEIKL